MASSFSFAEYGTTIIQKGNDESKIMANGKSENRIMSTRQSQGLLTISKSALSYSAQLCAKFGTNNEIGGLGLGSYDEKGFPVVMALLPPGPNACFSGCHFADDADFVNAAIDYGRVRYGLSPLHFWHLHPGILSEPSGTDLTQCIRFTKKFELQNLGYMIMTTQSRPNERSLFWGKYMGKFGGRKSPLVTVNSYIFCPDQCRHEPCKVKTVDYDGIQRDILDCEFIPERYKLPICYPDEKLNVIGKIATDVSIPASFTEAFSNLVELAPPEIFIKGEILTAERVFDDGRKIILRYRIDSDDYRLIEGSIHTNRSSGRDITKALRDFYRFDQMYLAAYRLATSFKEGV